MTILPRIYHLTAGLLLLCLCGVRGAQGQPAPDVLRIGLQTKQTEVRLQGTTPLRVETAGTEPLTYPADTPLLFRCQDAGVALLDTAGAQLLATTNPVTISSPPTDADAAPCLRLLGPTRHYDGKPDRPYRGVMEILPRATGLTVVNVVDVESYLQGVVSSEMSPDYPLEALKAQAVAARTYALQNRGRFTELGYDLDDTPYSQVYGGIFSEDPRTTRAVQETAGKVITYNGKLINAVYSSTCGGYTESAEAAWGNAVPYLVSVPCYLKLQPGIAPHPQTEAQWAAYCKSVRALNCLQPQFARPEVFRWWKLMTRQELEAGLPAEYKVGTVTNIVPVKRGDSGRITALRLEGSDRTVTIEQELPIRRAFGMLRSSAFTVDIYRDDAGKPVVFAFFGAGWGHGIGLCQVGAVGLATSGWDYEKILTYYYKGTTVHERP